jgi:crotonobetainyl-CoA:carnitine CoA-transferase CaiB-like acyl-CoA transferase
MKLEGYRVVDLSQFLPGPYLSMLMADQGADVIKIEAPGGGDPGRHIGAQEDGQSVFFRNANRGKRSVCLNLKDAHDREVLARLLDTADVVIEGFRPGIADRLGCGADEVRKRNPRIVYCSISAFGQVGPYRNIPAHDLAVEAISGTLSVNVGADDNPAIPALPNADMSASLMALAAILMALLRREKTGLGDRIDISMHDALVACMPNMLGTVFAENRAPTPKVERSWGGAAFYNIYATSDGRHIVLGAQEMKFVRPLLLELGRPDLIELCERGPGAHQRPVTEFLRAQFVQETQAHWISWFAGRDVAFAPVKNLREAMDDPHLIERGMILRDARNQPHLGVAIKFYDEPARPQLSVPAFGEHTAIVLREIPCQPRG